MRETKEEIIDHLTNKSQLDKKSYVAYVEEHDDETVYIIDATYYKPKWNTRFLMMYDITKNCIVEKSPFKETKEEAEVKEKTLSELQVGDIININTGRNTSAQEKVLEISKRQIVTKNYKFKRSDFTGWNNAPHKIVSIES